MAFPLAEVFPDDFEALKARKRELEIEMERLAKKLDRTQEQAEEKVKREFEETRNREKEEKLRQKIL